MHNHFDRYLNFREIILKHRPSHIVECGADDGKTTRLISSLMLEYPFQLTVITDNELFIPGINIIRGVSYKELSNFDDDSIDMCVIDTDHNYWTLMEEFKALHPKLRTSGWIILHDVVTYYHDTGMAERYNNRDPYPLEQIEECGRTKGSLGTAMIDWLAEHRMDYKLMRFVEESHGAAAIQKVSLKGMCWYKPAVQKELVPA